jgi:hypothetical protein
LDDTSARTPFASTRFPLLLPALAMALSLLQSSTVLFGAEIVMRIPYIVRSSPAAAASAVAVTLLFAGQAGAQPVYYVWPPPVVYVDQPPQEGSARLEVKPKSAEVYVDGYLAGTVESFDGFLQRLHVAPGEHTLTLYLDGYRTFTQKVDFKAHAALNIKYDLQKLAAGESSGPRPQPAPGSTPSNQRTGQPPPFPPASPLPPSQQAAPRMSAFGTLTIRVQPPSATVVVDGQEWENSGPGPLSIELAEGSHDVEVRQNGFASFHRTVQIHAGDTTPLNVSLSQ